MNLRPVDARAALGRRAESLVAAYLEGHGFGILARNVRIGRLEIDIIARKPGLIVFCEVRALSSDRLMSPAHTIGARKVQRVRSAAAAWLHDAKLTATDVRFDAAAVVFDTPAGRIDYYEGAF